MFAIYDMKPYKDEDPLFFAHESHTAETLQFIAVQDKRFILFEVTEEMLEYL